MFVQNSQARAMFHSLIELNRKAAIQQAMRDEAIKQFGGLPCPHCRTPMTLAPSHLWKWTCNCSPGIRFHES